VNPKGSGAASDFDRRRFDETNMKTSKNKKAARSNAAFRFISNRIS